jgi:hypothetical protein
MSNNDDDDRKAKDLIDAGTQRDLERWFGLPSFTQIEEEAAKAPAKPTTANMDPEVQAVIARRAKALETIDPVFLEEVYARHGAKTEDIIVFEKTIDVRIAESDFGAIDEVLVERTAQVAEPREYELSEDLRDDMKDCTPQAMLRDLHRPEKYFDKQLEIRDPLESERVDVVNEIKTAMTTRWNLVSAPSEPMLEKAERDWAAVRSERRRNWLEYLPALPNRRVSE